MKVLVFNCRKVLEINCRKLLVSTCFLHHCDLYVHRYDILSGKIAPPEGFEIHGKELRKIEKKKPSSKDIEEYEERISYLEEKARKTDDFGFEEKE